MENPPKKFFRLAPGSEVRLKGAYIIKCNDVNDVVKMLMAISWKSDAPMTPIHAAASLGASEKSKVHFIGFLPDMLLMQQSVFMTGCSAWKTRLLKPTGISGNFLIPNR